jgi:putative endonuclease
MDHKSYICYMITHEYKNTYVGITNDFNHRLNQHNGIIKGGAKATHKYNDWELAFYISGFETKNEVLSFEWHMHHPNGKRRKDSSSKDYYGVLGRIRGLCQVLMNHKFENNHYKCFIKSKCVEFIKTHDIELYTLLQSFVELIEME